MSAAVALLIKVGSPGPIFFRQRRVGYKGREFVCFKFRTMGVNAETDSHRRHAQELIKSKTPMIKLDARKDPRLIPLGSVLRASGLDELPQLFNVLRGEMSLVGPRPCIPYECEAYEPWHWQRFDAVPGLDRACGRSAARTARLSTKWSNWISNIPSASACGSISKSLFKTVPALWRQYCDLQPAKSQVRKPVQQVRQIGLNLSAYENYRSDKNHSKSA